MGNPNIEKVSWGFDNRATVTFVMNTTGKWDVSVFRPATGLTDTDYQGVAMLEGTFQQRWER